MITLRTAAMIGAFGALGLCAVTPDAVGDPPELYTGVRHEALFAALNVTLKRSSIGAYYAAGVEYRVDSSGLPVRISRLRLAVFPSRALAERELETARRWVPAPAHAPGPFSEVGDTRYVWSFANDGTINFLRDNVNVMLNWSGARDEALALARRIDQLIQTDRNIAPRGRFTEAPEIVSVGAPERIVRGATVRLTPVFRGLGPVENLRILVHGLHGGQVGSAVTPEGKSQPDKLVRGGRGGVMDIVVERTAQEDGRFELGAPAQAALGPQRAIMVVATPDNLIVTKEFTIAITDE